VGVGSRVRYYHIKRDVYRSHHIAIGEAKHSMSLRVEMGYSRINTLAREVWREETFMRSAILPCATGNMSDTMDRIHA
jgi:hypothetical protein